MQTILLTGAAGNVGQATLRALRALPKPHDFRLIAGVHNIPKALPKLLHQTDDVVKLDFTDAATFGPALAGVDKVLLVRPPQLSDVAKYFQPFITALARAEVKQTVFLSLQGVENNPVTPHYKIEALIRDAGLPYTMLRPSFFMQNLSTTHQAEIRDRNEIFVPAGHGRTAFVDVQDLGDVAALVLTQPGHLGQAYELTGPEALTYAEVAVILSDVLRRRITYRNPAMPLFLWRKVVQEHQPLAFALVMTALYTVAKLGKADTLTDEVERLLGRPPTTFRAFAEREWSAWLAV